MVSTNLRCRDGVFQTWDAVMMVSTNLRCRDGVYKLEMPWWCLQTWCAVETPWRCLKLLKEKHVPRTPHHSPGREEKNQSPDSGGQRPLQKEPAAGREPRQGGERKRLESRRSARPEAQPGGLTGCYTFLRILRRLGWCFNTGSIWRFHDFPYLTMSWSFNVSFLAHRTSKMLSPWSKVRDASGSANTTRRWSMRGARHM